MFNNTSGGYPTVVGMLRSCYNLCRCQRCVCFTEVGYVKASFIPLHIVLLLQTRVWQNICGRAIHSSLIPPVRGPKSRRELRTTMYITAQGVSVSVSHMFIHFCYYCCCRNAVFLTVCEAGGGGRKGGLCHRKGSPKSTLLNNDAQIWTLLNKRKRKTEESHA